MNEKRRPQGRNDQRWEAPRRADRFAERAPAVEEVEGQLEGRNAITEALKAGRTIDKVFVAAGDTDRGLQRLAAQAKEAGAVVVPVDRRKLDQMSTTRSHQGIIALAAAHDYCTIDDLLEEAASRGEAPLLVICDELSDPHNLGAIMRSAECAGAHGVIIPKRRSVGLTATVAKASAGAVIALPGGFGTLEELLEIITWKQLGLYKGAILILNTNGFYNNLLAMLQHCIEEKFMKSSHASLWHVASSPQDAISILDEIDSANDNEIESKY